MWFFRTFPQGSFFFDVVSKPLGAFPLHFLIVRFRERKSTMCRPSGQKSPYWGFFEWKFFSAQMGLCPKPH